MKILANTESRNFAEALEYQKEPLQTLAAALKILFCRSDKTSEIDPVIGFFT